jgi:hypothetical protein
MNDVARLVLEAWEKPIQPHGLRKFCRPVRTDSLGEQVPDVARQLGCTPAVLYRARLAGIFKERRIQGLGGKRGYPVPLIQTWTALDPNGTWKFGRPDPLWGSLWEFLPDMIPDDFEQTILRRPHYKLFPVKGAPSREYWDRRFRGWRWVCPACKKEVRFVFYPLPPDTLFDFLGYDPALDFARSMFDVRRSSSSPIRPIAPSPDLPISPSPHPLDSLPPHRYRPPQTRTPSPHLRLPPMP